MNHHITKELVKAILTSPHGLKWSVQGLGMLRTYLSQEVRLHVWDSILKVPYASPLHDHPWHLHSYIVAGEVRQYRYKLVSNEEGTLRFTCGGGQQHFLSQYNRAKIKCGENACTVTAPEKVWLQQQPLGELCGRRSLLTKQRRDPRVASCGRNRYAGYAHVCG